MGTISRWWGGARPGHFIVPVAFPDLAIGVTAFALARGLRRDEPGWRPLATVWNLAGAGVLMAAPVLMQLSQPGPLHRVPDGPDTDEVLGFPMSIVPTFVAPFLVAIHAAALYRLHRSTEPGGRDE